MKVPVCDRYHVVFRGYTTLDREWVAKENVRHYTRVEGFDPSFAEAVRSALDLLEAGLRDPASNFLIAEETEAHRPIACVFLMAETPSTSRIRLFYLEEAYRGRGIGKAMLKVVTEHASRHGFRTIRVSTFHRHHAACRLYRSAGFAQSVGDPSVTFGQELRQVDFEKDLASTRREND